MATIPTSADQRFGILPQLKVRTRLYLGFALLIAVALLLAGAGSWGIGQLGGQITRVVGGFAITRAIFRKIRLLIRPSIMYIRPRSAATLSRVAPADHPKRGDNR